MSAERTEATFDSVEFLRGWERAHHLVYGYDSPSKFGKCADEIVRLRNENDSLKQQLESATTVAVNRGKRLVENGIE